MSNRFKIIVAIVVIAVFCVVLAGRFILYPILTENAGISKFLGEPYAGIDWTEMKTPHLSDTGKVDAIIDKLPVAEGVIQRFSSVGDDYGTGFSSPNTLTIYYEPDLNWMSESDWLVFENLRSVSYANALMLFSLIDDLEEVCFAVRLLPTPGNELIKSDYTYAYTESRELLTKRMTEEIGYKEWNIAAWSKALDNNYAWLRKYVKKENEYLRKMGVIEGYLHTRGHFSVPTWSYYTGYIGSEPMTLDDVRELGKKGSNLSLADLSPYKGIGYDFNGNIHFEFEVEEGYFLAVYPGYWNIRETIFGYEDNSERGIWGYSSSDGIDIRYNDVNEFIEFIK